MISNKLAASVCVLLLVSACATRRPPEVSNNNCSKELGACQEEGRVCVIMGIPHGPATCDVDCQARVLNKLYVAGISSSFHTEAPSFPLGCVGYRADLGGTKEGAQCIAKMLGYEFYSNGCNEDGWPYNVRVR